MITITTRKKTHIALEHSYNAICGIDLSVKNNLTDVQEPVLIYNLCKHCKKKLASPGVAESQSTGRPRRR